MGRPTRLDATDLEEAVRGLDGWAVADGTLRREFRFENFVEAFGFMTRAALVAESMDHHPDWSNVYSRVVVSLSTHDAGGITSLDVDLARRMSELADTGG